MKHLHILILSLLLAATPIQGGWFNNNEEKLRRIEIEKQLDLQRKTTDDWQIVAGVLVIGAVILFTVGTALGSKLGAMEPAIKPRSWREILQRHWSPKKIDPPTVDPDIEKLSGPQRTAEVLRYTLLSLEWWLSPNGRLREWLKLNGKISSILLVPAVLVIPLVTFSLWQGAIWIALLVQIAGGLIVLPLAILLAAVGIAVVVSLIKAALKQ